MALIVTPGDPDANSYATVAEMDTYLENMAMYTIDSAWDDLSEEQKEARLTLGVLMMESMSFRGVKACRDQNLSFPRWISTDDGYPSSDDTYLTTEDITDAGYDVPAVPDSVKYSQIEMTYQVIHKIVSDSDPGDSVDRLINKVTVGSALAVEFGGLMDSASPIFSRARITAMSVVSAYLVKWLRRVTGGIA